MSGKSPIQWTEQTWNPVVGCKRVSAGCDHCYAFALHDKRHIAYKRGNWPSAPKQYHKPFSQVQLLEERLRDPLRWRKPRRIFVNSMSDLFHEDVPYSFINEVWMTMRNAKQHVYQILTKRPARLLDWTLGKARATGWPVNEIWPDWIWLGVSVENQAAADERIPLLAETPAAVRFLSMEPLLERVNIDYWLGLEAIVPDYPWEPITYEQVQPSQLDWVIVGGESGKHARDFAWEWIPLEECRAAGVPIFVKQLGSMWAKTNHAHDHHGGDMSEWREHLRVREYPAVSASSAQMGGDAQ